jgi:hypothetical protein
LEVTHMNRTKQAAIAVGIAVSGLLGGLVGAAVSNGTVALSTTPAAATSTTTAATSTTTATASPSATTTTPGRPNEDPTHEAGESAAREAAENNGTATYGPPASSTPSQ